MVQKLFINQTKADSGTYFTIVSQSNSGITSNS